MAKVRAELLRVAPTPLPVVLSGETGTGKEVAARALHEASGRPGAFVAVDCAALAPSLIESELFGHVRGAFTGAERARDGLVHAAREGTFFLDEVGDLGLDLQTRLLRLLEAGTYRPVGAARERPASVRFVAATWRDLRELVAEGRFRRDLFHRLSVVEIRLPPLRERGDDVADLLERFLDEAAGDRPAVRLSPSARRHLLSWPWPGNVRELRNVAQWVTAMAEDTADLAHLPPSVRGAPMTSRAGRDLYLDLPYLQARRAVLDAFQVRYVLGQLDAHGGNVSAAARAAGMDRRSIQRILGRARELARPDLGQDADDESAS